MRQDRLLFGLIGVIIGLIAGMLIVKRSPTTPIPTQAPTKTVVQQMEPQKTVPNSPAPHPTPAAPSQPQQQQSLPEGHPRIEGQSIKEQIAAMEEKVKKDPHNQTALVALGNLNADSGNMPKAAEWYTKAVANEPQNVGLITDLGTCYLQMRDFDKASEQYSKALAIDPNHYQTLINMGILYMATGEKSKAADTWEKVVTLYPNDPRAPQLKGAIQKIRAGQKP
jgi:cytochrome c-type biogenesis protein CcmH/NrfG